MNFLRQFFGDNFRCRVLGWHKPTEGWGMWAWNGCSFSSTCVRCGKPILRDSQGNWF